jgi:hypothetical protein
MAQILDRDAALWCREIVVDASYRLLLALAGMNRRYFTRFQVKRMQRWCASLALAPTDLAARIEALLLAAPAQAFAQLHALEGEVIELAAAQHPDIDFAALRARRAVFAAASLS